MAKRWKVYKSFLHRMAAFGDALRYPWTGSGTGGSFRRRCYGSYSDYIRHQASKLEKLDLTKYDAKFANALQQRLKELGLLFEGKSVLCLAARSGAECKAFISLGGFSVGVDLNAGRDNQYVVHGDFHRLQYADGSVDYVFTNSLDHALDLEMVAREIKRVLKPTGLFIAEIVHGSEDEGGRDPGTHESLWWNRSEEVIDAFRAAGYVVCKTQQFNFPFAGIQVVFRPLNSNDS